MSSQLDVSSDDPGLPLRHVDFSAPARPGPNTPRDRWGSWQDGGVLLLSGLWLSPLLSGGSLHWVLSVRSGTVPRPSFLLDLEMVGTDASADLHLGLNFERPFY